MKNNKNYFFKAFLTLILAVIAFVFFQMLLPERLFPEVEAKSYNIVVDSFLLQALADTTYIDTIPIEDILPETESEKIEQENFHLTHFFEKLRTLEKAGNTSVRIAYYGDSMIEGDLIVRDIRKNYQNKYGGRGAGLIPLSLPIASASPTIRHDFSKDWIIYSYLKKSVEPVGVNGYVFFKPDSVEVWSSYKAGTSGLVNPVLLYGKSNNDTASVIVSTDVDSLRRKNLTPNQLLNTLKLSSAVKDLTIRFSNADSIPFYGVNFADSTGVYVDNFSSRGNSGLPLSTFNVPLTNAFQKTLGYDLIVLQYGTNVLSSKSREYGWYAIRMANTVKHLRRCFPNASILVISLADKATKYGMEMKSDSALIPLINAQQTYARNTQSGFINLFELMGGEGAMVEWVDEDPPLAAKDYTHFSGRGSKKIADLIFGKLEEEYEIYKKQLEMIKTKELEEVVQKEDSLL